MKLAMIGTGYVGLVSGVCFSDFGHEVVCVDKDAAKIDALKAGVMAAPRLADLRNVYDPADAAAAGFAYVSIGR